MSKKIQIVKCKCGSTFAACWEPMCYEDKDWQKNLRKYLKQGATVATIENPPGGQLFQRCTCPVPGEDPNQIKLFND